MTLPSIRKLEALAAQAPAALPDRLAVYGAGGSGRKVAQRLRDRGISVVAFLDRRAKVGQELDDLPVLPPAEGAKRFGPIAVVVAIHNPSDDLSGLPTELASFRLGPIYTLSDLCNALPGSFDDLFWIATSASYLEEWPLIQKAHDRLSDDGSRELYLQLLRFRLGGGLVGSPVPEGRQYFPSSLPPWQRDLRLIDCGAYTGDTLEALLESGYRIPMAICLEPDSENYAQLVGRVKRLGIEAQCFPCAVSDRTMQLSFSADNGSSSHLASNGETKVQAIALDDALPGFTPNLIKMDIEGAEPDALSGAAMMIERTRPGLAISVYHRANHLWRIPLQVAELFPESSISIRAHAHNSFEVVLYARSDRPRNA